MAYEKTEWKARKGTNLNRFEKSQETNNSVILENAPSAVTEPGTPFSVDNMNKIEQGIYDAHEGVAGEARAREQGDNSLAQAIESETAARQQGDNTLAQVVADEMQAREAGDQHLQEQIDVLLPDLLEKIPAIIPEEVEGIRTAVAAEAQARQQGDNTLAQVVADEARAREAGDQYLSDGLEEVAQEVALKANDVDVVKLTKNQTITGEKTFSTSPVVPAKSGGAGNNPTVIATEAQVEQKQNKLYAYGAGNIMLSPTSFGGQPGTIPLSMFVRDTKTFIPEGNDLNNYIEPGVWKMSLKACNVIVNSPIQNTGEALLVVESGYDHCKQTVTVYNSGMFTRFRVMNSNGTASWSEWRQFAYTANPVFTGTPKVGTDLVAAVSSTLNAIVTNLPIGSYIVLSKSSNLPKLNSAVSPGLPYGVENPLIYVDKADYPNATQLSGTWRSCGGAAPMVLCRRVS